MAQTEGIAASNDEMLLALIASLQGLTLTLQANLGVTAAAQPAAPTSPPTAPASSSNVAPAVAAAPTAPPTAATFVATAPSATATVAAPAPPVTAPAAPPTAAITPGTLAAVYLTPHALASQGVHPTVLEVLPDIVSAPESGAWFVITVGRYTGIYLEWPQVSPLVNGWSRACYNRLPTKAAALAAYDQAWRKGFVRGGIHPDHEL